MTWVPSPAPSLGDGTKGCPCLEQALTRLQPSGTYGRAIKPIPPSTLPWDWVRGKPEAVKFNLKGNIPQKQKGFAGL